MIPRQYFVYILASKTRRLYTGVTNDLVRRMFEHRTGAIAGFTRRYGVVRLVHFEVTGNPRAAIAREEQLKGWLRSKKIALIESENRNGARWRGSGLNEQADPSLLSG